jgi:hypothetical protein
MVSLVGRGRPRARRLLATRTEFRDRVALSFRQTTATRHVGPGNALRGGYVSI